MHEVVVVQIVLTEDLAKNAYTHGHTVPRRYAATTRVVYKWLL
jgi:hypothetical protein